MTIRSRVGERDARDHAHCLDLLQTSHVEREVKAEIGEIDIAADATLLLPPTHLSIGEESARDATPVVVEMIEDVRKAKGTRSISMAEIGHATDTPNMIEESIVVDLHHGIEIVSIEVARSKKIPSQSRKRSRSL